MKLKIYSFNWENFSWDEIISVTLSTLNWEITVLDKHVPLLTAFKPSTMFVMRNDDKWIKERLDFAIWVWFLEVSDSEVKILTDMLIDVEEQKAVDKASIEKAKAEALALMEKYKNSKDRVDMEKYIDAENELMKSIAQLKLYDM